MSDQQSYSDPAEIRHAIGAEGALSIQAISGTVELRAADTDEAVVVVRSERGRSDALPIIVQRTDGGLHIEVSKRSLDGLAGWLRRDDASLEFEATIPRRARVEVTTVSSDIRARFLGGDQGYKTVSGDIDLDPDGGRIRATSVSGDIEVRAAEPIELAANSTSGDIEVKGAVLARFEARTISGDVEFQAGLMAGPVHTVESVSGDLSVESTTGVTVDVKRGMDLARGGSTALVAGDGAARLRFRTLSGDCHVEGARRDRKPGRHRQRSFDPSDFVSRDAPFAPGPPEPPAPPAPPQVDRLDVLRALERGEIDVDEAARRLQEAER